MFATFRLHKFKPQNSTGGKIIHAKAVQSDDNTNR